MHLKTSRMYSGYICVFGPPARVSLLNLQVCQLNMVYLLFPSLLAAIFASSPYLQTGPVALTALLTFGALQGIAEPFSSEYIELAALLALMVGVIRLILGICKMGFIAVLLTDAVVLGFTTGAAILIISSQLPKSLGLENLSGGIIPSGWEAITSPNQWETGSILFSLGTICILLAES